MSSILMDNYYGWTVSSIVGLVTFYLIYFYLKVFTLPKGPFPLPLFGNILLLRGIKKNPFLTIDDLVAKYGSVFTFWLGNKPAVVISDLDLVKQAFNSKNNELNDRIETVLKEIFTQSKVDDIFFANHSPILATLRRVTHSAVRKLYVSEKLANLVNDTVDQTVGIIMKKEGINKPFDPSSYITFIEFNIIALSAFGKRYSIDDPEFNYLKNELDYFHNNSNFMTIVDSIPIIKPFYKKSFNRLNEIFNNISRIIRDKFDEHLKNHEKGVINDLCDGLIEAKEEALIDDKELELDLTDQRLSLVIFDMFFAGSDTIQYMLRWIILFMANNTDIQSKMREEVESVIGDRIALHEDISKCHFVNAFIYEVFRYRPVAPFGVPHKAKFDTKIGNFNILKDTIIAPNIWHFHSDGNHWDKPELFDPKRFLTTNHEFNASKYKAFTPFGIGRRNCLGEKLTLTDLFFITVGLLQSISGHTIALPDGDGSADLRPNPNVFLLCVPNTYKIILKSI